MVKDHGNWHANVADAGAGYSSPDAMLFTVYMLEFFSVSKFVTNFIEVLFVIFIFLQEFSPNGEKVPVKSTVSLSPRTPSAGAPSSSSQTPATPDVEETAFVRRTSPRKQKKRKPDESTPLSTGYPVVSPTGRFAYGLFAYE